MYLKINLVFSQQISDFTKIGSLYPIANIFYLLTNKREKN